MTMEMNLIGSATFVESEKHNNEEFITDEEAEVIASSLAAYLHFLIKEKELNDSLVISGVQWTRGYITIIITFNIIGAVAGGHVAIDAIKDYKEVREGLIQIFADLKNAGVWIRKKFGLRKQIPGTHQLPAHAKEHKATNNKPFDILFEQAIKNYESVSPKHRKYWAAGQHETITNDNGETIRFTLALKREDVLEPKEIKKLAKKSRSKK